MADDEVPGHVRNNSAELVPDDAVEQIAERYSRVKHTRQMKQLKVHGEFVKLRTKFMKEGIAPQKAAQMAWEQIWPKIKDRRVGFRIRGYKGMRQELMNRKATWQANFQWMFEMIGLYKMSGYLPLAKEAPSLAACGMLMAAIQNAATAGKMLDRYVERMCALKGEQNAGAILGAAQDDGGRIGALEAFVRSHGDDIHDDELVQIGSEGPAEECGLPPGDEGTGAEESGDAA